MAFQCLSPARLVQFIDRLRRGEIDQDESYLQSLLLNVLSEYSEFVDCDGFVVVLDDPVAKRKDDGQGNVLTYVATMGTNFSGILGKTIPSNSGLLGESYTLGKSMVRKT